MTEKKVSSSVDTFSDENEEESEEAQIEWSNLIFLPFHFIFKMVVLFSVILKCILGPIQSVYPVVYCWDIMDRDFFLTFIKYFYCYCCDPIYGIDTFLHIVHRQVTDKAMRREHLPKSAFLLLVDIVSLIPIFRLVVTDMCPPVLLWPNILAFSEFVIIYRVVEYFSLVNTHSVWNMFLGFTLLMALSVNCCSCFWLLLTSNGLCANCKKGKFDWRYFVMHKLNETDEGYTTYVYSTAFVFSFAVNKIIDETKPSTMIEFVAFCGLAVLGNLLVIFVVFPKMFAEAILRLRRIFAYYAHVKRMVAETKRRNSSPNAYIDVENVFCMMWKNCNGINRFPDIITDLPRNLRVDLKQDLVWSVFYHSPILRKSSSSLKRMLCELIVPDYKLPGEKLYSGMNSLTHLIYLKSGVVQILSADDGITPIISATSGTILGDISFQVPPLHRKTIVRCLTYCEIFFLTRLDYIRSLHKFPNDCRQIRNMVKYRMNHARTLYNCKQHVRGLDRTEDEGIAWIKRRWWEISESINNWKNKAHKKDGHGHVLPPEEAVYHCSKYIGQLVLCTEMQLQTKSLFANAKFPWILLPLSSFVIIWHRVVTITVFLVLILYPPNITSLRPIPTWFRFFVFWTNYVYAADICVSLLTAVSQREKNITTSFAAVMFARCKTLCFILDVLATIWTEYIVNIIGKPEFYYVIQFNRLIKIYKLFTGETVTWNVKRSPIVLVFYKVILSQFCWMYIVSHVMYIIKRNTPEMTTEYFFGRYYCEPDVPKRLCEPGSIHLIGIATAWALEFAFPEYLPKKLIDIYYVIGINYIYFLLFTLCKSLVVAALYLKNRQVSNFQYFVSNLKKYFQYYKIHTDLLNRLDRYLNCHWKYHTGADITHPYILRDNPYDIYWKVQGEIAEKIIRESRAFIGTNPQLIRELAYASKFLILPKNAVLLLFGVLCKNVSWLVQGQIKCEFHNDEGELIKIFIGSGHMLSTSSVFMSKGSLKTYTACTECEILYIKTPEFFKIILNYPEEWRYFEECIKEFEPAFDEIFQNYLQKHRDYQKKLRERIFHSRVSVAGISMTKVRYVAKSHYICDNLDVWEEPESDFMKVWMTFRAIIAILSILCAAIQGGSGVVIRWKLIIIGAFCDSIAWMDIVMKILLAYYDDRGLLITDKMWCVFHYLTRSFLLDVIGALPWFEFFRVVMRDHIDDDEAILINTFCKFAHLYIIMGYFDYIGDSPTVNVAFIKILKWQVVSILLFFGVGHYLFYFCVDYTFDQKSSLVYMEARNGCWMPKFRLLRSELTVNQLHILYAESLNLAQSGLMKICFGRFHIDGENLAVGIALAIHGLIYWFIMCYCLALLVLNSRGNTLFQQGIGQLRKFLNAEGVEKSLIKRATTHFTYWWMRTKGINLHQLTSERIGVVLRQDLNFYFLQNTFAALDTLLLCGESSCRQLASSTTQVYVLPNEEILRENDIISHVYVVHRGKVTLSQKGEKIVTLTKGCIFGQLHGTAHRPVCISAMSEDYADLLQIHVKQFQEVLDDRIRYHIAQNPQSAFDYMATKKHFTENPYDTIQYILRGRKIIKLPFMSESLQARHGNWYATWLYIAWLFAPITSVFIALILLTLPPDFKLHPWLCFISMDAVHVVNFLLEFFTIQIFVVDKKCVKRLVGLSRFKEWTVYFDAIGLLLPMLTYVTGDRKYLFMCFLRLRLLYNFQIHFCRSFKSKTTPVLMQLMIVILLLHAMSCGWISIACRDDEFPVVVPDEPGILTYIDRDTWVLPSERKGGCARTTKYEELKSFVVPKHWQHDYIVSMQFIIMLQTQTAMSAIVTVSLKQIYYKLAINFFIYSISLWVLSVGISLIYTKYRELYQYDYNVTSLITFLRHNGISPPLLDSVREYTTQLWRRQRGTWLPELAQQAPLCLREDLFCALYMHHLETPGLFRQLPPYFVRQLAARLHRVVVFPGKSVVQEGDMVACIYFIHEGEVEKWYTDQLGNTKMMSLLTTNGYFGLIPGLFPNVAFQFSYYTRTVVDFVFLRLRDWQDLLDGYPDVKRDLYTAAKQLKRDFGIMNSRILMK